MLKTPVVNEYEITTNLSIHISYLVFVLSSCVTRSYPFVVVMRPADFTLSASSDAAGSSQDFSANLTGKIARL